MRPWCCDVTTWIRPLLRLRSPFWGFLRPHGAVFACPGLLLSSPYPLGCLGSMGMAVAALAQPVLGLFTPPQGPFRRRWAVPIQPRGNVGCLVQPVLGILHPALGPFCRGPAPSTTLLGTCSCVCIAWVFFFLLFQPTTAILQAGCFSHPPGFSHGWLVSSCADAACFITAVHLVACCHSPQVTPQLLPSTPFSAHLMNSGGCNQHPWLHPPCLWDVRNGCDHYSWK
jgi:hypothetical protein